MDKLVVFVVLMIFVIPQITTAKTTQLVKLSKYENFIYRYV